MPRSAFQALGITEGDPVEIIGKRATVAIAMSAYDEDQAIEVIRLDGLQRGNAEVGSGEHVKVKAAESRPATRVVFAPANRDMRLQGPAQALKRNFAGKPLTAGDLVATTGQQPVQNMPPEAQEAFGGGSDGGLGALDDALKPPPTDGQESSMGGSAEALDAALSQGQVQGGGGVSSDDATISGAEGAETVDDADDGSSSSSDEESLA